MYIRISCTVIYLSVIYIYIAATCMYVIFAYWLLVCNICIAATNICIAISFLLVLSVIQVNTCLCRVPLMQSDFALLETRRKFSCKR